MNLTEKIDKYLSNELVKESTIPLKIEVQDERHVGKNVIILMRDTKTQSFNSAVVPKKLVNKYNRNNQDDLKMLWELGKKYGLNPIKG